MDQNISGMIATNVTLMQPWYNPLINVGAGVIGGLVTGAFALAGVWIANKSTEEREKQNNKEEARRSQRKERKDAYIKFITIVSKMAAFPVQLKDKDLYADMLQSFNEISLLSPSIYDLHISKIINKYPDVTNKWKELSIEFDKEVIPLMRAELNNLSNSGED